MVVIFAHKCLLYVLPYNVSERPSVCTKVITNYDIDLQNANVVHYTECGFIYDFVINEGVF